MLDGLSRQDPCYFYFFKLYVLDVQSHFLRWRDIYPAMLAWWLDGLAFIGRVLYTDPVPGRPQGSDARRLGVRWADVTSCDCLVLRRRDHSLSQVYCAWLLPFPRHILAVIAWSCWSQDHSLSQVYCAWLLPFPSHILAVIAWSC